VRDAAIVRAGRQITADGARRPGEQPVRFEPEPAFELEPAFE
jgi:hypothetical protein